MLLPDVARRQADRHKLIENAQFAEWSADRLAARQRRAAPSPVSDRAAHRNPSEQTYGRARFALRQGWVPTNPCRTAEKPAAAEIDADIRFLDQSELDALLAAAAKPQGRRKPGTAGRAADKGPEGRPGDELEGDRRGVGMAESTAIYLYRLQLDAAQPVDALGRVDRALYLIAAMTGMRQGELFALRWMDVDWLAHRVRVRRNYVHGRFGTPKSKR
jgi:integrase